MFTKKKVFHSLLIMSLLPAFAFSAPAAGKVRSTLGSVDRLKPKQNEWAILRVGASIYQSDKVRTGKESEVIFGMNDGSSITIAENSEVEMSSLLQPNGDGGFETRIDIKKGHINFTVRKLKEKKSNFQFKTGTATASIRGTEGYIGGKKMFFAGLKNGKLDVESATSSNAVSISAGETTFGKDSLVVLKLASSGDPRFAVKLEKLLENTNLALEELIEEVKKTDEQFQAELLEEQAKAEASMPENSFTIESRSPIEVCDQGLTIEGSYKTVDPSASLVIKVGKSFQSSNLIRATDGKRQTFSQKIAVTDANGLWSVNTALVVFTANGSSETKDVSLNINKKCVEVNSQPPVLELASYDSLRCVANYSVSQMQDDAAILYIQADGAPIGQEAITRDAKKKFKLQNGIHEYELMVEDQAGNKVSTKKTMGCYPNKRFNVDVVGPAKEVLRVPPPPPGSIDRVPTNLRFKIRIPENDPSLLNKVTIKHNGNVILQETLTQIQDLDYDVSIELNRGIKNKFELEVIHKSGYKAKASKIYEVR